MFGKSLNSCIISNHNHNLYLSAIYLPLLQRGHYIDHYAEVRIGLVI